MRQGPDQLPLLQRLLRIRNGTITQQNWLDINARYEQELPSLDRQKFNHNKVLTLMESWAEVNAENHEKIAHLQAFTKIMRQTAKFARK